MKETLYAQRANIMNVKRNRSALIKSQREVFTRIANTKREEEMIKNQQKKEYVNLQKTIHSHLKDKDREEKRSNVKTLTEHKILYEDEARLRIEIGRAHV